MNGKPRKRLGVKGVGAHAEMIHGIVLEIVMHI